MNLLSTTPIVVRATAGLRLLNETQATAILRAVEAEIASSGFLVAHPNLVEIMSGVDEGIFSWFTLNFLLDRLQHLAPPRRVHKTVVALDLGGGSTQITFLSANKTKNKHGAEFSHDLNVFGERIRLYTHRFACSLYSIEILMSKF